MSGPEADRATARGLARFEQLALPAGSRVLLAGPGMEAPAAALVARGLAVETRGDLDALPYEAESFDAALLAGVLERTEWDRWGLQQVHRVLRSGAPLVLVVPNMLGLASAWDVPYALGIARKVLSGFVRRRLGRAPAPRRPFVGRKYRRTPLAAMLERVGFDGVSFEPGSTFASGWTVVARRLPGILGSPGRPWPDPALHRARFERSHREFLDARDRWAAAHPGLAAEPAKALDPSRYAGEAVLVIAPHPDDEILGCGGTLARLQAHGARITIVHATDGCEATSLIGAPENVRRNVRLDEALAVARRLGVADVRLWREDNAAFRERDELVERLRGLFEELDPALVFVPFVTDIHPDHRVVTRLLAHALAQLPAPPRAEIMSYAVWSFVPPNRWCVVTEVAPVIDETLLLYVTAMKVEDYNLIAQERNYYNACVLTGRPGFAEVFHATPARAYPELLATMESPHG